MKINELVKKIEPFIAIGVLIMLLIVGVLLYQDNQLKKEISRECGWGEDDYYCFCEKSEAMEIKNKFGDLNISNVELDK